MPDRGQALQEVSMLHLGKKIATQPMAYFVLIAILKIALVRAELFQGRFAQAFYIELPVLIALCILVEWISQNKPRLRMCIYLFANGVLSLALFALIIYYQYFNSIATYTSLFNLNQAGDVRASIRSLIEPWYWLLIVDIPLIFVALLISKLAGRSRSSFLTARMNLRNRYGVLLMLGALVIALVNTLLAIGGGTVNELVKARKMGLLTYQAYAVYSDIKRSFRANEHITPQDVREAKGIRIPADPNWHGVSEGADVYMIQLESVQNFVVGLEVAGQEVTPNLNDLVGESFYFDNVYQQIAKGNTSDAEFIANTSLYPTGILPMSQQTAGLDVPSLPKYLDPYGYESVTLHTNEAKFWDRDSMYPSLGFDRYYDKEYFGEEDVIHFGASDEVLFRKSIDVFRDIKSRGNRIYANLITMSCHNPFDLPEDKQMLDLPKHLDGTYIGNYLQSVHYADYALGIFIEELQTAGLWDEAMLVVYGDHFGISIQSAQEDLDLLADLLDIPEYTRVEMFNVPLIIRVPGITEGIVRHNMGGQIDILPTVMNLLGVSYKDKIVFGQDLLNHEHNLIGERVYLPSGSFLNEEVMFIPGEGIKDGYAIPLQAEQETRPATHYSADYYRALKLLEMSDDYIASLPPEDAVPVMALKP